MTALRHRLRAALPVAALLATTTAGLGVAALGVAGPASAAGNGITSPAKDGIVFSKNQSIPIRTSTQLNPGAQLRVAGPGQGAQTVDSGLGQLSYDLNTSCYPTKGCSGYHPAVNGTWTVTMTGSSSRTFVLAIAAQAPRDVTAAATDPGQVKVSWQRGVEPDLVGYVVGEDDAPGGPTADTPVDDACTSGGSCSTVLRFSGSGYAGAHNFVVRARRAACPGCSDTLLSAPSDAARVTVTEPVAAAQAPSTTGTPAPAGSASAKPGAAPASSPGATAPAGTAPGKGQPGTTTFGGTKPTQLNFGAALGLSNPALPKQVPPSVAQQSAKLPPDTFSKTLGYPGQPPQAPVVGPVTAARPTLVNQASDVPGSDRLWRGIAGALVLVLLGAHLRRWLSGTSD